LGRGGERKRNPRVFPRPWARGQTRRVRTPKSLFCHHSRAGRALQPLPLCKQITRGWNVKEWWQNKKVNE
jgi:hypothetical protein